MICTDTDHGVNTLATTKKEKKRKKNKMNFQQIKKQKKKARLLNPFEVITNPRI